MAVENRECMMKPSTAIGQGLTAAWRNKWMVSIFFGCNLLMAAAVAAPMHDAIADHVGNSAVGQQLADGFSAAWLTEFTIVNNEFLKNFSLGVMYAGILFLALNTLLAGGAFEVFSSGAGAGLHAFGRGMGKYFGRFARIAVIGSLLYFLAFWIFNGVPEKWIAAKLQSANAAGPWMWLGLARVALLVASVLVVNALLEYARADMVTDEHASAIAALLHAAGFFLSRFGRVMFIYLTLGLLTTATIAVYVVFARWMPQHSVATIFIWFAVAQALLWIRWMLRLASWGAAVAYYGSHARARDMAPTAAVAAEA
ncbi:MAG: hypothetical protein LAN64_05105 [Acidobacteriia bacterium]|nr:hypothetical protein [Terriglobia bacterium]